jgi:hypothetical protein
MQLRKKKKMLNESVYIQVGNHRIWILLLMNFVFINKLCVYMNESVYIQARNHKIWILILMCVYWWIFEMNLSLSKQETTGYGSWNWWIVCSLMNFWNECDSVFIDELCVYMNESVLIMLWNSIVHMLWTSWKKFKIKWIM